MQHIYEQTWSEVIYVVLDNHRNSLHFFLSLTRSSPFLYSILPIDACLHSVLNLPTILCTSAVDNFITVWASATHLNLLLSMLTADD